MMKAIVLFSGGLDSILAAGILKKLGVDVIAVNFMTPFTGKTRGRKGGASPRESALKLGVGFREIRVGEEYLELVRSPDFGYGKNVNPCIDCKIFFIRKAGEILDELGASFIATGEVLGQRPMSQNRRMLERIGEKSGFRALLLRPLSAKLLPPSLPEREGWVDRERLFGFSGRSRTPQMELAGRLGIHEYPNAGGGCLLTYKEFSRKISDLIEHGELSEKNVELLKFGRHFRIEPGFRLVVGRDASENPVIEKMAGGTDYVFRTSGCTGPVGLGLGKPSESVLRKACGLMARYASTDAEKVEIRICSPLEKKLIVEKAGLEEIERLRI